MENAIWSEDPDESRKIASWKPTREDIVIATSGQTRVAIKNDRAEFKKTAEMGFICAELQKSETRNGIKKAA
ncbi:hypothetical protein NHQ30_000103 [Ciborinia camelliae]|nr:hypothetical protein NHQ30_000103 [Ciborinia camelliae]